MRGDDQLPGSERDSTEMVEEASWGCKRRRDCGQIAARSMERGKVMKGSEGKLESLCQAVQTSHCLATTLLSQV